MLLKAIPLTAFFALSLPLAAQTRKPPIFDAVRKGDIKLVKQLAGKGGKALNQPSKDGVFLIYLAADSGNREVVTFLAEKGADVNARSETYDGPSGTALEAALRNGDLEMAELLVARGAKADVRTQAVNAVASAGNMELLRFLQEHGADLQGKDARGDQAIHRAAGRPDVLRYLIEHGADPRATNDIGNQPIHEAAKAGNPESITLLLEKGADANAAGFEGDTPLHLALNENTAALLLKSGAKVDQENQRKEQPIHRAASAGDLALIRFLLSQGAMLEARDEDGQTPLDHAAFSAQRETMAFFLEKGAKPTDRTLINALNFGRTDNLPLLQQYGARITANVYLTAYRARTELFPMLDADAIAGISGTVLPDAVEAEDMPLVKTLLDAGAVVDAVYPINHCCLDDEMKGAQAIHYAAGCKDPAFMALLLEKGAKPDAETVGGLRPIHIAAAAGNEAIIKLLLAAGADATAKDPDGKTAWEVASKKGRKQILALLPKP